MKKQNKHYYINRMYTIKIILFLSMQTFKTNKFSDHFRKFYYALKDC
jgi:hypothetical protein